MKTKYVCRHCGSDELTYDATAFWSVEKQGFELGDLYDNKPYCNQCECEGWAKEVEVSDETV